MDQRNARAGVSVAASPQCESTPSPADLNLARLASWLERNVEGFHGLSRAEKFPGGQSNPTYQLSATSGSYVLRRKPFGDILPSAHAVEREYRLISALHPTGFPVARPFALCEDSTVVGSPFYVMEMVEGRTLWDGKLPDEPPSDRRSIYESMIGTLADLHNIEPSAVGLADYGPAGNYFERQVRRWTKQYRMSQTDDIADVEALINWLQGTLPNQERIAIIHGDYRIDNLIFDRAKPKVQAVLDWELSTLGDPLADFAYVAMNWALPATTSGAALGGCDLEALNIPTLDAATALYCERTGRDGVPDLNWYFAYSLFRLLAIVQGIKKRFLDGNASSAQAEQAGSRVAPLAAEAMDFARRAEPHLKLKRSDP